MDSVAYGKLSLSDTLRRRFGITLYLYYLDRPAAVRPRAVSGRRSPTQHPGRSSARRYASRPPLRKVRAWIELHDDALMRCWERAMQGPPISKID